VQNIPPGAGIAPAPPGGRDYSAHRDQALWDQLRGRPLINIPVVGLAAAKQVYAGACLLVGWALRETAAGAATADIWDGADTTGELVASLAMVAAGGAVGGPGADGVLCLSGVFFNRLSGTWQGSIWIKA
jgi:hypothetical protein